MGATFSQIVVPKLVVTAASTQNYSLSSYGSLGLRVTIDVTARSAGTLTVTINEITSQGTAVTVLIGAALSSVTTQVLQVSPFIAASANAIAQAILPANLQISVVTATSPSLTYSIDATFVD